MSDSATFQLWLNHLLTSNIRAWICVLIIAGDESKFAIWNASARSNEEWDRIVSCIKLASSGSLDASNWASFLMLSHTASSLTSSCIALRSATSFENLTRLEPIKNLLCWNASAALSAQKIAEAPAKSENFIINCRKLCQLTSNVKLPLLRHKKHW